MKKGETIKKSNASIYEIIDTLKGRLDFLNKTINYIEEQEGVYPEGALRISGSGREVYYHRKEKSDRCGMYISRKDVELARLLAQKEYEQKYKKSAMIEANSIKNFLCEIEKNRCTDCYSSLNPLRQKLVKPFEITDSEYIEKWNNIDYVGLDFDEDDMSEYITDAGERVRSKSEVLIANTLYKYKIPYKYECPLMLNNHTVYPDFTLLNVKRRKVLYWEHFGMMGDAEYCNNALRKINRYSNDDIIIGDRLIVTFESIDAPISTNSIQKMIEMYL